jgi:hypothetical protein
LHLQHRFGLILFLKSLISFTSKRKTAIMNPPISRTKFLKSVAVIGAASVFPFQNAFSKSQSKKIKIVGLGSGGLGIVNYISSRDSNLDITLINSAQLNELNSNIKKIQFDLPNDAYVSSSIQHIKKINLDVLRKTELSKEIQNVFSSKDSHYVLFTTIGGFTGSHLLKQIGEMLLQENKKFTSIVNIPSSIKNSSIRKFANIIKGEIAQLPNTHFFDSDALRSIYGNYLLRDVEALSNEQIFKLYQKEILA